MQFSAVIVFVALSALATAHPAGLAHVEKRSPQDSHFSQIDAQANSETSGAFEKHHNVDATSYQAENTPYTSTVNSQTYKEANSESGNFHASKNGAVSHTDVSSHDDDSNGRLLQGLLR